MRPIEGLGLMELHRAREDNTDVLLSTLDVHQVLEKVQRKASGMTSNSAIIHRMAPNGYGITAGPRTRCVTSAERTA
jgi:hypothetical protein